MAVSVTLPELGESVTEGTVTRWLKNVGDTVAQDEPLVEIATDKVDTEIPSPESGVLVEICAWEDDTVEIGGLLARIASKDDVTETAEPVSNSAAEPVPAEEISAGRHSRNSEPEEPKEPEKEDTPDASDVHYCEVLMPEVTESTADSSTADSTTSTIIRWCTKLGDHVHTHDPLLEVSISTTAQTVTKTIPSPANGILVQICAREDGTISTGQVLAVLQTDDAATANTSAAPASVESTTIESESESESETPKPVATPVAEKATLKVPQTSPSFHNVPGISTFGEEPSHTNTASTDRSYVTPLVRKLAAEKHVDLAHVHGSGLGRRIVKKDILDYAATQEHRQASAQTQTVGIDSGVLGISPSASTPMGDAANLRGTTHPASPIRQSAAAAALAAGQSTAQVSQVFDTDVTNLLRRLTSIRTESPSTTLSLRACAIYVVSRLLRRHPALNASYDKQNQQITYYEDIDLSIGIDTPQGLLSPVLHHADQYSLNEIGQHVQNMEERYLNGTLTPRDLSGGTFTLSHPTSMGALWETPLVIPPQSAALSIGTPVQRPVVVDGADDSAIAIRDMVYLTLSYDACLIDSSAASCFLHDLQHALREASFLDDTDDDNGLA